MAGKIGYTDKPCKKGVSTKLEWYHLGRKWRPLLGHNLTEEEKVDRAAEAVQKILDAIKRGEIDAGGMANSNRVPTLEEAAKRWLYPTLERLNRRDQQRPKQAMRHLSGFFTGPIDTIDLDQIHSYIDKRRDEGAAPGTIRREVGIVSRIGKMLARRKVIPSNPCDGVELPEDIARERIVTPEEIRIMRTEAKHDLWRAIVAELTTGLRREKLLGIETQWISKEKSGQRWLNPPKSDNKLKCTPDTIALGRWATWALLEAGVVPLRGRIFRRWKKPRAFSQAWERLVGRCKRKHPALFDDLHFHDLRHTFNSLLGGLGVPYQVIQFLMGHKVKGATWRYFHLTPELRTQLVDAATKLDAWLDEVLAENRTGASATERVNA